MPAVLNRFVLLGLLGSLASLSALSAGELRAVVFDKPISTYEWSLKELNPELPSDWTGYDFLVIEFRASSSQRFELGLKTAQDEISKRIHPFAGVWVRASIPLKFYRQGLGDAGDLAATVNQPRNSYWINIEAGGFGPTTEVRGLSVVMRYPVGAPKLEIRSVTLSKTDPGDAVLEGKPLVDEFGQYTHAEWPGKARSETDLKNAWAAEEKNLTEASSGDRDNYGGFLSTKAKATGFFRVEKVDGRWWLVTPEGHLFYSVGVNGIGPGSGTRATGREDLFAKNFPGLPVVAGLVNRPVTQVSPYVSNLQRRFGESWNIPWAQLTSRRLEAWGINTSYGPFLNDSLGTVGRKKPYVFTVRNWNAGPSIMGMPDVYSEAFTQAVDSVAARELASRKDDPWMVGYFIGNEPPWPARESQMVDLVINGPSSEMQKKFKAELAAGDTPERRRDLVLAAFGKYLATINAAVKKYDPNHLNLGIRFGGTPPDYVVKMARGFDVYSLNKYRWTPPPELLDNVATLTGLPILVGEFHIGVPNRGMAPGLVQAMNQEERAVAYQYYVEQAAAHPSVIGTHWFQWVDQPVTGRPDGENYNIGWIDVTDRPYAELVDAAKLTHARLLEIHSGKTAPVKTMARASEVGTPADAMGLGKPAIQ